MRGLFCSILGLAAGLSLYAQKYIDPLPTADEVVEKVCASAPRFDPQIGYRFQKYSLSEELDKKGSQREHKEKRFEVVWTNQVLTARLASLNGVPQNARPHVDAPSGKPSKGQRSTVDAFLKSDLIARFQIEVVSREWIHDRATLVLAFKPRSKNLPVHSIEDRVINKLVGTVWIDELDYQVAKCEIRLAERTTMLGGIVGALDQCTLSLTRVRMPEGAWLNEHSIFQMSGRKLFEPFAVRVTERADNFCKLDLQNGACAVP